MIGVRDLFLRLACGGLCLAAASPAVVPTGVSPSPTIPVPAPAKVAAAPAPLLAPRPVKPPEDPRVWATRTLGNIGADGLQSAPDPLTPKAAPIDRVAAVSYRQHVSPIVIPAVGRVMRTDREHAIKIRPAIDVPPLALAVATEVPGKVAMPSAPTPRSVTPDPVRTPLASLDKPSTLDRATLTTDPTPASATLPALALIPGPRTTPAPAQLVRLPEPTSEIPGSIINIPHADDDAPLRSIGVPEKVVLSGKK